MIADVRNGKLIVIKWEKSAAKFLEGKGFLLQDTEEWDVPTDKAYVKECHSENELHSAVRLLLDSSWGASFL